MGKPQTSKSPEDLFFEATEDRDLSSGDLRLLVSGLTALRETREKPLNEIERQSITNMIAFTAFTQGVCEETVTSILTAKFGAENIKTLPSQHYQNMIEYLVDLEIEKVMN